MSDFSLLDLFKSQSKIAAKKNSSQLTYELEKRAISAGFSGFHELRRTAPRHPEDPRLLRSVFNVSSLDEVVTDEDFLERLRASVETLTRKRYSDFAFSKLFLSPLERVTHTYQTHSGTLDFFATSSLTLMQQERYGSAYHWLNASLRFEAKYRNQKWSLVESSIHVDLSEPAQQDYVEEKDFPMTDYAFGEY